MSLPVNDFWKVRKNVAIGPINRYIRRDFPYWWPQTTARAGTRANEKDFVKWPTRF